VSNLPKNATVFLAAKTTLEARQKKPAKTSTPVVDAATYVVLREISLKKN
jgi:hypothetical protein